MRLIAVFLLSVLIFSCEDDPYQITSREYPRLLIQDVTDVTSNGARFTAEFRYRGSEQIINYGFVWDDRPEPLIKWVPDDSKFEVPENIGDEQFSLVAQSGIEAGIEYFVRAFVQTDEYTVYSVQKTFVGR